MPSTQGRVNSPNSPARPTQALGPAVITAALMFGPGSITLATTAGAKYGYQLLWVPILATLLMAVFCDIAARIGLATQLGSDEVLRRRFGPVLATLAALSAALVCSSFQAGNSVGTGVAATIALPGDPRVYAAVFTTLAVGMVWLPRFYKALESVMSILVAIMLIVFVITMLVARPSIRGILSGLLPSFPSASAALVVGITATTFSVVGALFQIQLIKEKGWDEKDYHAARIGVIAGIVTLGLLSFVVMATAAAVMHPVGHVVKSPADLAVLMEPAVGAWAAGLFALGLWGAAFSSLIGNGTIGGGMLSSIFGRGSDMNSKFVKVCISAVMAAGGILATIFGKVPLELITTAQAVTIFGVPLIGILLVILSRSSLLRQLRVGVVEFTASLFGVGFLLWLAYTYAQNLM